MIPLTNLTDDAYQTMSVALADGSKVTINLYFRPATQRWSMDIQHPTIPPSGQCNGKAVVEHPNLFRQFRNVCPFGIACVSTDGGDPVTQEDFVSGRCSLFVLDESTAENEDVDFVEENIFGENYAVQPS